MVTSVLQSLAAHDAPHFIGDPYSGLFAVCSCRDAPPVA
jgi:hypothetical protein